MDAVRFQSVRKVFRHTPGLAQLLGRERTGETVALRDVDVAIEKGEIFALLGPNGSGKTTLLKLISTMLLPDAGVVSVLGFDTAKQTDQVRKHVGIAVPNERSFYPRLTATENLDFFGTFEDIPKKERRSRITELLSQVGLSDAADTLVMKFSTGMFQRLAIARALLKRPQVLLLDEPTRSLDPLGTQRLWQLIKETAATGTTLIVASHDFEEAALADRFCVLDHGEVKAVGHGRGSTADQIRAAYFSSTVAPVVQT